MATINGTITGMTETNSSPFREYAGVFVRDGTVRRVAFQATDAEEARAIARDWNIGVEGPMRREMTQEAVIPVAFDAANTRRMLGNISYRTLYAWHAAGKLERVPNTRKLLTTRESIERLAQARSWKSKGGPA